MGRTQAAHPDRGGGLTAHSDVTGARLGRVVLGYLAMTVAIITLAPLRFSPTPVNHLSFAWKTFDVVMNVVMFVPIGFIYQLSRRRGEKNAWMGAFAVGALFSAVVESAQFFLPGRFPSVVDLATNTVGAVIGAALATAAFQRADGAKTVRAIGVELPLMGLVYLLIPLAWLSELGSGTGPRALAMVPLAACAAWTIASVFRSFEQASLSRVVAATLAWLGVALAPGLLSSPRLVLIAGGGGLLFAVIRSVAPALLTHESKGGATSRRFEAATLNVVLPVLFLYLVFASLTPAAVRNETWSGMFALLPPRERATNEVIFRALEHIAAFTLIGYAIAEYFGRVRDRFRSVAPVVALSAAVVSAALEWARGWHPAYGASVLMFTLTLFGAVLGGWLYILQLAHVRALTGNRPR